MCDGLQAALDRFGCPMQLLTDNGKVFTGRFKRPPAEVRFDQICRANGIEHLLTAPRSATTTGTIERFHRTLRAEFDTSRVFPALRAGQAGLDRWVQEYNTARPHQSLDGQTPAQRFTSGSADQPPRGPRPPAAGTAGDRSGSDWVSRRVASKRGDLRVLATDLRWCVPHRSPLVCPTPAPTSTSI